MKDILFIKTYINNQLCAVPKYQSDIDELSKAPKEFSAKPKKERNIDHHRKLFAIFRICIDNGIYDKIMNIHGFSEDAIQSIVNKHGEQYGLLYICKFCFLEPEIKIRPDGVVTKNVNSIGFDKMDQIQFSEFYDKCLDWFSSLLDVDRNILELEKNNYY